MGNVNTEDQTTAPLSQQADPTHPETLHAASSARLDIDFDVDEKGLPNLRSSNDVAAYLGKARTLLDLHRAIKHLIESVKFTDYAFRRVGRVTETPVLTTFPKELSRLYVHDGLHAYDLLVEYASINTRPIRFSKIYGLAYDAPYDPDRFRANQQIYELHQKFGYLDHYCIPMMASDKGKNVMLIVSQRGISPAHFEVKLALHRPFLHVLCEAIDYVLTVKHSVSWIDGKEKKDVHINPKPLLVLNTLANNDMTIAQVADKLHISDITANQHLAGVRRELGVKTTVAAIKKAIELRLIKYTDSVPDVEGV